LKIFRYKVQATYTEKWGWLVRTYAHLHC